MHGRGPRSARTGVARVTHQPGPRRGTWPKMGSMQVTMIDENKYAETMADVVLPAL